MKRERVLTLATFSGMVVSFPTKIAITVALASDKAAELIFSTSSGLVVFKREIITH